MLENHYMDASIPFGEGSIAYFARKPAGVAIIFVHGFIGSAIDTWASMHEMLPKEDAVKGADVVFYGYKSTAQALGSADLLRRFVSDFCAEQSASQRCAPIERRKAYPSVSYKEVLIVAHSLGGAIARRATLDALSEGEAWVEKSRLLLFAPAHRGAILTNLKRELKSASKVFSVFAALVDLKVPVLRDLEPTSPFIDSLRTDTLNHWKKHPKAPLKADGVIFGQMDNVILMQKFCNDPASTTWQGRSHISVCKATDDFADPLREVLRLLSRPSMGRRSPRRPRSAT